jgi:hypothetical protein
LLAKFAFQHVDLSVVDVPTSRECRNRQTSEYGKQMRGSPMGLRIAAPVSDVQQSI